MAIDVGKKTGPIHKSTPLITARQKEFVHKISTKPWAHSTKVFRERPKYEIVAHALPVQFNDTISRHRGLETLHFATSLAETACIAITA